MARLYLTLILNPRAASNGDMNDMRQNEEKTTRQNLTNQLKAIHPANILGGIYVIFDFSLDEFHGGIWPEPRDEHPIFHEAAGSWCFWQTYIKGDSKETPIGVFPRLSDDYSKLLSMLETYLAAEGLSEAHAEITRIQSGLALQGATLQTTPVRAGWRYWLTCAIAICGAALLDYICASQDPVSHFGGEVALLIVAAAVWNMGRRYAHRSSPALSTQPTR